MHFVLFLFHTFANLNSLRWFSRSAEHDGSRFVQYHQSSKFFILILILKNYELDVWFIAVLTDLNFAVLYERFMLKFMWKLIRSNRMPCDHHQEIGWKTFHHLLDIQFSECKFFNLNLISLCDTQQYTLGVINNLHNPMNCESCLYEKYSHLWMRRCNNLSKGYLHFFQTNVADKKWQLWVSGQQA